MSEAKTAEALARLELDRLSTRVLAARQLLGSMEMTDDERGRFGDYIQRMQRRQGELLDALDGHDETAEAAEMTEARVGNVEATLRHMDERLTRIVDQIHTLDSRQGRLEDKIARIEQDSQRSQEQMSEQMRSLQEQMKALAAPPGYSRMYLAGGALAMTVVIVLLVLLTWRML